MKLEDYPHLVEMKKKYEQMPFGTIEYWRTRCRLREKIDDETYSKFERDNCYTFWKILVSKEI